MKSDKFNSIISGKIGKIAAGFIDQGLLSALNFAIGIIVIKNSNPATYGMYVTGYSILMLLTGFQNALITTQVHVLAPGKPEMDRSKFCTSLMIGQYVYWVPVSVLIILSTTLHVFAINKILLVLALITPFYLLREYQRAVTFMELKPWKVLAWDMLYSLLVIAGVWMYRFSDSKLPVYALAFTGIGGFICGGISGVINNGKYIKIISFKEIQCSIIETFKLGKWAIIGVLASWLQTQIHIYLLSFTSGFEATGLVNASRQLLMPIVLFLSSYDKILRPQWVRYNNNGNVNSIKRDSRLLLTLIFAGIIAICIISYFFENKLVSFLFTKDYTGISKMIIMWGFLYCITAARTSLSIQYQVFRKFKLLSNFSVISAVVTVLFGLILIPKLGNKGALLSMICGEVILLSLLYFKKSKPNE